MRYAMLSLLVLAACSSPAPDTTVSNSPPATGPTVQSPTQNAPTDTPTTGVLRNVEVSHLFSSPDKPDKFRLQLRGTEVLTAKVHFSIVTAAGDTLWTEHFPAADLASNEGMPETSAADQQAAILKRADTFFQANMFSAPAIKATATFDPDLNGKQDVWAEVKQRQLPGFSYLLGYEDGRTLAYSPQLGKAVMVRNCC